MTGAAMWKLHFVAVLRTARSPRCVKLGYFFLVVADTNASTHCAYLENKKHFKNVGPIHYCEPPHAQSPDVVSGTVTRRLRINVHNDDDNDNA